MSKIIFTGGGSGGHVLPAITLINKIQKIHPEVEIKYIGGKQGIEKDLLTQANIPYKGISTGKLRRYFSLQNFIDIFKIGFGLLESFFFLLTNKKKGTLLFGTGGFVAVAPVIAAKLCGMKVIIHEQTSRAGLANRICARFADRVFTSFDSSNVYFPAHKVLQTGIPLRDELFNNDVRDVLLKGKKLNEESKPIIFITGGGNGSLLLNEWVKTSLDELTSSYLVIHQVGKKFIDEYEKLANENYIPISFVGEEIVDIFKLATFVVSRAGANTVFELMSLGKKSIYIPLKIAQKNDQFYNAKMAEDKLGSILLKEEEVIGKPLSQLLSSLPADEFRQISPEQKNPTDLILSEIEKEIKF